MWDKVSQAIVSRGGEIHLNHRVVGIDHDNLRIIAVKVRDETPE